MRKKVGFISGGLSVLIFSGLLLVQTEIRGNAFQGGNWNSNTGTTGMRKHRRNKHPRRHRHRRAKSSGNSNSDGGNWNRHE